MKSFFSLKSKAQDPWYKLGLYLSVGYTLLELFLFLLFSYELSTTSFYSSKRNVLGEIAFVLLVNSLAPGLVIIKILNQYLNLQILNLNLLTDFGFTTFFLPPIIISAVILFILGIIFGQILNKLHEKQ